MGTFLGLFNTLYIPVFLFMLILQQVKFLHKEEEFLFVCFFFCFVFKFLLLSLYISHITHLAVDPGPSFNGLILCS